MGPRSVYRTSRYLIDQVLSARLKTRSEPMKQYITRTRQEANREFNRQVADVYRQAGQPDVRENVKRLGRLRIARPNGDELGDVDVLVVDRKNKVLLAVEVKDFEFARTPFELSNEIEKLLGDTGSAAAHHHERLTFMRGQLPRILNELSLDGAPRSWQVQGLIVTSNDLMAAHYPVVERARRRLRIIDYEALTATDGRSLTARSKVDRSTRADRRKRRRRG